MEIKTNKGVPFQISPEDYHFVKKYKWHSFGKNGSYIAASIKGRNVTIHSLLMGCCLDRSKKWIDHKNRDGHDNRRENLRFCTPSQNNQNKKECVDSQSGYKGVYPRKSGGWKVEIKTQKKHVYIGDFSDKIEAAKAYNSAAIQLFGSFAKLNDI